MVSERLVKNVTDCVIRKSVLGSDHCPLVLGLSTSSAVEDAGETEEDETSSAQVVPDD